MNFRVPLTSLMLLLTTAMAYSQTVYWSPPGGTLQRGVQSRIDLIFDNCSPKPGLTLPDVDGLRFGTPLQNRSFQLSFSGRMEKTVLSFPVVPEREGEIRIPDMVVETTQGAVSVSSVTYQSVIPNVSPGAPDSGGARPQLSLEDVIQAELVLPKRDLWAGEIIPMEIVVQGLSRYFQSPTDFPKWQQNVLMPKGWSQPEGSQSNVQGRPITTFRFRSMGQVRQEPGVVELPPGRVPVRGIIESRRDRFGRPLSQDFEVIIRSPEITIRELPAAPSSFSGGIGSFQLESRFIPSTSRVGEPITWNLKVTGTGNWESGIRLPDRKVPAAFEVIQPKSKVDIDDDGSFSGAMEEDMVLIPKQVGTYEIPGLEMVYFDPEKGSYQTLRSEPMRLVVEPASATPPHGSEDGVISAFAEPSRPNVAAFATTPEIPQEPLDKAGIVLPVWPQILWVLFLVVPWILPLGFWVRLLRRRWVEHDPLYARRAALAELRNMFASPKSLNGETPHVERIRPWQELSVRLWSLPVPLPGADALEHAVRTDERSKGADADEWRQLWEEAERSLFADGYELPADWSARAEAAARGVRLPAVDWRGWFKAKVWWPLAVVLCCWTPALLDAQDVSISPSTPYQSGAFQKAEAAWRLRLTEKPADVMALHNLSLALFQQKRLDEAAAAMVAAASQSPTHPSVRWNTRLILEKSGWSATLPGQFLLGNGLTERLARLLSPGGWQLLAAAASLGAALALTVCVRQFYSGATKAKGLWAPVLLMVMLLLGAGSLWLRSQWGMLRFTESVVTWSTVEARSIPTETDQETRSLPPGTPARVIKSYLSWAQIELPNREIVWVRQNDLMPVHGYRWID